MEGGKRRPCSVGLDFTYRVLAFTIPGIEFPLGGWCGVEALKDSFLRRNPDHCACVSTMVQKGGGAALFEKQTRALELASAGANGIAALLPH